MGKGMAARLEHVAGDAAALSGDEVLVGGARLYCEGSGWIHQLIFKTQDSRFNFQVMVSSGFYSRNFEEGEAGTQSTQTPSAKAYGVGREDTECHRVYTLGNVCKLEFRLADHRCSAASLRRCEKSGAYSLQYAKGNGKIISVALCVFSVALCVPASLPPQRRQASPLPIAHCLLSIAYSFSQQP